MTMQPTTRESGNAPGLPAGRLTRRSALQGSAFAAIALAAGVTIAQAAATAPDAALIELAQSLEVLIAAEQEAWTAQSEAEDAAYLASPQEPQRRGVAYPFGDVDALTPDDRFVFLARPGGYNAQVMAADADHKAAMEAYARTVARIAKRYRIDHLEREARRLSEEVASASAKLAEMRAVTPRGVRAKAVALLPFIGPDTLAGVPELERHLALLGSLLEDAARVGMGAVS